MTTFTSDDREEAYKKIVEAAPNQPGYEDAVPIPYNGLASKELTEWEIEECWDEATGMQEHFCSQYFDFAQLILRKASEK